LGYNYYWVIIGFKVKHQPLSVLKMLSVLRLTGHNVSVILLTSYWCKSYWVK